MVKDRSTVIFYPATVCNLNCRYCSIDKNPALIQIDKILEESLKVIIILISLKKFFLILISLLVLKLGAVSLHWVGIECII